MLPQTIQEQITYIARLMFERRLTDISGGNISARIGETLYLTPRFAGAKLHWRLAAEDILSGDVASDEILESPRCSRESRAHLSIYRNFPDVHAIIHAHPYHVLPFCVAEKPIRMVLESTQKFGIVDLAKPGPAHSQELADNIVAGLRSKEEIIRKQAAGILIPKHGIILAGKDLFAVVDALERIDWNARCILLSKLVD